MKGWEDVTEEQLSKLGIKYTTKTHKKLIAKKKIGTDTNRPKNKYNAVKTEINGIAFDSKKEADYYSNLLLLKKAGIVESFVMQKDFTLQDAFTRENGERIKATRYRADFVVRYKNGHEEVVDVKGMKTRVYINKKKMLLKKYPNINFKEV